MTVQLPFTMQKKEKAPSPDEEFISRALDHVYKHLEDEYYDREIGRASCRERV